MGCEHIALPDGGGAIVCRVRARRSQRVCSACGRKGAEILCDWTLPERSKKGKLAPGAPPAQLGIFAALEPAPAPAVPTPATVAPPPPEPKTCDRPLCRRCATAWGAAGPDRDLCPEHAVEAGLVGAVRIPCWPVYGRPAGPPPPPAFHPRPSFAPAPARRGTACR